MPRRMTENESQEFLAEPRIGVLSVARGSDRPPHTPVWYAYQPGKASRSSRGRKAASPASPNSSRRRACLA